MLAYPHPFIKAPRGAYTTLDDQRDPYWPNVFVTPDPDFPEQVVKAVQADYGINTGPFVALTEEGVPAVGMLNDAFASPGLTTEQALVCTNRPKQRAFLEGVSTDLNPDWAPLRKAMKTRRGHMHIDPPFFGDRCVVKSSASTLGRGVEFVDTTEDVGPAADEVERRAWKERSRVWRAGGSDTTLVEKFVGGVAIEVDSVVNIDGDVEHLAVFRQHWSDDNRIIVRYERLPVSDLAHQEALDVTEAIINHLGLVGSGFSAEYRWTGGEIKVIEFHARLGEDNGPYAKAMGLDTPQILYDAVNQ